MRILFVLILVVNYNVIIAQNPTFEIQGHRGCRGLMPENTIPAFKKAIDLGVNTLEMDVVVSKDLKIVVSHEPNFNPQITTKPDGTYFEKMTDSNLYLMPYAEIEKYDVGKRGNPNFVEQQKMAVHKPLLTDVIREVNAYLKQKGIREINYNIEIKSLPEEYNLTQPEVKTFCDLFLKTIAGKIPEKNLSIQSFDFNVLKYLSEIKKSKHVFKISALIEPEDNNDVAYNLEKLGFLPDIWSPYFKELSAERVNLLHSKNIRVIPWTVNEVADMQNCKKIGCDGIITDYPNRTKSINPAKN